MSAARKRKKAAQGQPSQVRFDRLYDKRELADPAYLIGQQKCNAPIKYQRCPVCIGRPHHSPWLDGAWT